KDAVRLPWQFVPGQAFYQEATEEVAQTMQVQQMKVSQSQSFTLWSKWTPVRKRDGKWTLTQQVLGLKIDLPGIRYDSRQAGPRNEVGQVLDALTGTTFTWTLGPDFKAEKFEGLEAFLQGALRKKPEQVTRAVRALLRAPYFEEMVEATFAIGP